MSGEQGVWSGEQGAGSREYGAGSGMAGKLFRFQNFEMGDDIGVLIKQYSIDEICVAISNISNETCMKILKRLRKKNINTSFVPNLYKVFVHRVKIKHIGQIPLHDH